MLRISSFVFVAFAFTVPALAETPRFNRDIRPLLSDRCFACHGPDSAARQAELRLDHYEGATEWAVIPGNSAESELIARISSSDPDLQMPPADSKKKPLTPDEVALLRRWIDGGAEYEPHWAYLPPTKTEPPTIDAAAKSLPANVVDHFLWAEQQAQGIEPAAEASPEVLVRRLYLDLIGLPPTPTQVAAYVADARPDAYERLVDDLLASPHYGERMASWWFDLVRFANSVGYHGDQEHRVTPYRDYVIKSFNDNLPFDQFTIEQLAGDQLESPTMWQRVATGYLRLNQTTHEGGAQDAEYLAKSLADRVRNLSEVWMAASLGCAECHDHKFDPYLQKEFYEMEAFFADVDHYGEYSSVGGNTSPTTRPPEMLAWTLPVYEQCRQLDEQIAALERKMTSEPIRDFGPLQEELVDLKTKRVQAERGYLPQMIVDPIEPREIRVLPRGDWLDPSGEVVTPDTPDCLPALGVEGRRATRLDLARWLTRDDHPLTARVVVNRLWHRYFGQGLTTVLIDMGSQTPPPEHQALLDWLAVDFVEHDWNIRRLVRQIVMSRTYRQSSAPRPDVAPLDPNNRLLARQNRYRLDAEQIRDAALGVSGLLQNGIGGAVSRPYQPPGYYAALNFPTRTYQPSDDEQQYRRSVYVHWQRQFLHPWLVAFDAPTREECTARRPISNTPSAALVLLNDPSFVEAAKALAGRALDEPGDDGARIAWAWETVLSRQPGPAEVESLATLLSSSREKYAADEQAAEALLAVGLSEPNADASPAEQAAWTTVCRVLLNLNETITRN